MNKKQEYAKMLHHWRFGESKDFQGERGESFKSAMEKVRQELTNEEITEVSKKVGWKR